MNRACIRISAIDAALAAIPDGIRRRLQCDWLIGADPIFVGLHDCDAPGTGAIGLRSYRNTAHVAYPYHQRSPVRSDRATTIVLPLDRPPSTVIHELGHVLDESLGFTVTTAPVSTYARMNRAEAFAEAFTAWIRPPTTRHQARYWDATYGPEAELLQQDKATLALFEELAR